jgi:hypothetical protein
MVYNVHYCLDQIFVSFSTKNSCNLCGTKEKKDCCKDEVKVLKTDVAQKTDLSFSNDSPLIAVFSEVFYSEYLLPVIAQNQFSIQVNAPPDKAEIPLFISYCNFRI